MKRKNINKRILVGMMSGIMLTTPFVLTSCTYGYEYVTDRDGSVKLNPDKLYPYSDVKSLYVIKIKTKINERIYLAYFDSYLSNGMPRNYYDVFTGKGILYKNRYYEIITEGVELLSEERIEQYLISYNMLKDSYCVEDLKVLLEKIKQDVYSDNNKELVKNK